jgi:hypothetical protein
MSVRFFVPLFVLEPMNVLGGQSPVAILADSRDADQLSLNFSVTHPVCQTFPNSDWTGITVRGIEIAEQGRADSEMNVRPWTN